MQIGFPVLDPAFDDPAPFLLTLNCRLHVDGLLTPEELPLSRVEEVQRLKRLQAEKDWRRIREQWDRPSPRMQEEAAHAQAQAGMHEWEKDVLRHQQWLERTFGKS
jgi:hypothetical protein